MIILRNYYILHIYIIIKLRKYGNIEIEKVKITHNLTTREKHTLPNFGLLPSPKDFICHS